MTNSLRRLLLIGALMAPAVILAMAMAARPDVWAWLVLCLAAAAAAIGLLAAEALIRKRGEAANAGANADALRAAFSQAEQTRRSLSECEARLRLALAADDVSVYELDLAAERVWFDHRAAVMSGGMLPSNAWLGRADPRWRAWLDRLHPEDRDQRRAQLRAVIDGLAETFSYTYRFRAADGAWCWLAHRGAVVARVPGSRVPLRIVGVARDVTEQRDRAAFLEQEIAERTAALRESERRFRGIFDSAFQLTGLLTRDGVVLEMNPAARDFHGLSERDVIGRHVWEVGPWASSPRAAAEFKARVAQAAAGRFLRYETHQPDASGRMLTFDFSLKPIFDERNVVTELVAEGRDITERARLQAQLVQAQKMEAVGQLTGGVAHDFNNLLQALIGNLDLIRRIGASAGDARLQQLTANAQRAAARGTQLTRRLLAFSRQQQLRTERVHVSRLTAEMGELLRRAVGETVSVETSASDDLWPCLLDPMQFETTLLNLVINARDAMAEGGTVSIHAGNAVLTADAAQALDVSPGAYVRVDVADTGSGIPAEHLPRLFEPFFSTKEAGKGTGLGLAMVHGFARQCGGAVKVVSEPGRGTTVSLFLPRAAEEEAVSLPEPPRAEPPPVPAPARRGRLGILLVEDDAEVREAVQFALTDAGHRVHVASDADEALATLDSAGPLDMLLCDVVLPGGMDGLELADAARRRRPHLRVLLASGYGAEGLAQRNHGYEVLTKPFSQAELMRRVGEMRLSVAAK